MCRSLQNMVIPLVPKLHTLQTTIYSGDAATKGIDQEQNDIVIDMEEEASTSSGLVLSKGGEAIKKLSPTQETNSFLFSVL